MLYPLYGKILVKSEHIYYNIYVILILAKYGISSYFPYLIGGSHVHETDVRGEVAGHSGIHEK